MVLGKVVEYCISAVTIVNYCAQCELLIFYLREINIRMEEKTKELSIIMKVSIVRKQDTQHVHHYSQEHHNGKDDIDFVEENDKWMKRSSIIVRELVSYPLPFI